LRLHKEHNDPWAEYDLATLKISAEQGEKASAVDLDPDSGTVVDGDEDLGALPELCAYLNAAFGHPVRLDFGTGHECSFQVFLFSLLKLGCFGSTKDKPPTMRRLRAATISLYTAYLTVTRQLQTDYMLEPAGSHGVWGLDDYHCLPFYFGACQLQTQDEYTPKCIHTDSILAREGSKYLYFGCIRYIKSIKRGAPFFESSPMLNDISQLPTWQKVASGLLRLFEGEVLSKRQVVQHFVFGNIFTANWTPSEAHQALPPTETFRREPVGPHARAPWAGEKEQVEDDPLSMTRAPWAANVANAPSRAAEKPRNALDDGGLASTRAPWAT
jgi:Phosphotyrosyl phosphate activator (PTPA) protein